MKKTLLITLLLIPFLGMSQTTKPIEGFLGVKFGASKAEVMTAMQAKGGKFEGANSAGGLFFSGLNLGHRHIQLLQVNLFNDKAYLAALVFEPENEASTIGDYKSLVSDISEAYGKGEPYVHFDSPYKLGDGNETQALSLSEGQMFTNWKSGTNSIQVSIDTKLKVVLMYVDDATKALARAAQKAKEKSDF
ncbi:MAG: hypothetical protein NVSMB24_33680 [Mucilaginibacter sp.]